MTPGRRLPVLLLFVLVPLLSPLARSGTSVDAQD